jgi:hypothetical protein
MKSHQSAIIQKMTPNDLISKIRIMMNLKASIKQLPSNPSKRIANHNSKNKDKSNLRLTP